MFCDELEIEVIAGKGGDGCCSFRREKFVARGGPNGGDGGYGGDVMFKVNHNLNTLAHMKGKKVYKANRGEHGKGKNMHGKNAEHLIIEVPPGTIVLDKNNELLADLDKIGEQVVVARGGKGGLGNARFVSSTHQAPKFAEKGEPGESREIKLELKLVADVGIIGLPSAGKSTLISVISNAKPKIAAYHFTTLVPNLGVVDMRKFDKSSQASFLVADIPGLIEGASSGRGLGHQFLKHISRTKLLIHLIDGSLENADQNYKTIINELKKFDKDIAKKKQIIVINKIDLLDEETIEKRVKEIKKTTRGKKIFTISAISHENLKPMLFEVIKELNEIKKVEPKAKTTNKKVAILRPHLEKSEKFKIEKVKRKGKQKIFHVSGQRIDQLVVMTDFSNQEGIERIYHYINRLGIQKAVEKEGATFGDIIKIKDKSLPYRKQ